MEKVQTMSPHAETTLGMAEIQVTNHIDSVLQTVILGSGVAVAVYDPETRVAGMLHFLLPRWEICKKSAMDNPAIFADSGIPQLYRRCYKLGADKSRMLCYLIGGADVMDRSGQFALGRDNVAAAKDILAKNGVTITKEWVGGKIGRQVQMAVRDGKLTVGVKSASESQPI
jgi:chemotaxis protein CheD